MSNNRKAKMTAGFSRQLLKLSRMMTHVGKDREYEQGVKNFTDLSFLKKVGM